MSSGRKGTVLLVDDDPELRRSVAGLLEEEGYSVLMAGDGREAEEKLDGPERPSLILLDLAMPGMDGWEFLSRRQASESGASIPIVLLSGMRFIPGAPGVADFIAKPIRAERLLECVRRFSRG